MLVIFETSFKSGSNDDVHRRNSSTVCSGSSPTWPTKTITLDQLVQVPHSAAFQAQLAVDDVVVLVELLQGDADWCVVSYIGAG